MWNETDCNNIYSNIAISSDSNGLDSKTYNKV